MTSAAYDRYAHALTLAHLIVVDLEDTKPRADALRALYAAEHNIADAAARFANLAVRIEQDSLRAEGHAVSTRDLAFRVSGLLRDRPSNAVAQHVKRQFGIAQRDAVRAGGGTFLGLSPGGVAYVARDVTARAVMRDRLVTAWDRKNPEALE
jgi:hypothetical protein